MDNLKIGVIADIHADLLSLQAALALLDEKGMDQIICAGDLVGKGFEGDEVVNIIRERNIPCVMGNHDYFNIQWPDLHLPTIRTLQPATRAFLQQLPDHLEFEWLGKKTLMAHGIPGNRNVGLHAYHHRDIYLTIIDTAQADIVIVGHTHEPLIVHIDDTWIFNPGSVCRLDTDGSGTCAVLTLPNCQFDVYRISHGRAIGVSSVD